MLLRKMTAPLISYEASSTKWGGQGQSAAILELRGKVKDANHCVVTLSFEVWSSKHRGKEVVNCAAGLAVLTSQFNLP